MFLRIAGGITVLLDTLRPTHGSHLLAAGVPLTDVSKRLGHADTDITARTYSHAMPDDDARAADMWKNIVRGPVQ